MAGVYGTFLEHFSELNERCDCWNAEDASDKFQIIAVYMPTSGSGIKRRKYTSGNTGLDVTESDQLYVTDTWCKQLKEGTYIRRLEHPEFVMRLVNEVPYEKAAGYHVWEIERVTGTTIDKQEDLEVKEGYFA
jgi:hypothetical protein